ncbi:hypothetical protein psyc5s11_51870 [Clostridium gelidum]|uniref:Uncharacterized protein n=1 Tax=Clostridium gelidum TaxID=704125 RepID=A0ABN6J4C4_9CLOT|nr:hypothetical protein [Clostridium gelidum]BCZ49120.1 hypothetical protein psyc5s11_51870 [Clostridium gelidum]
MNKDDYISQEEMEEIDRVEVDKKILENIKSKCDNTFSRIQIRKILNLVKQDLQESEIIEFHCVGRNYSIDSARIGVAASVVASDVANPIFGWNTKTILIKTNMKMILVEVTMGWQYSKHYEISHEVHLVKKKGMFYLIVDGDNKKTIIEYNNIRYDLIINSISDKANIVIDKKFNNKVLKAGVGTGYLYVLLVGIVPMILIIIFILTN